MEAFWNLPKGSRWCGSTGYRSGCPEDSHVPNARRRVRTDRVGNGIPWRVSHSEGGGLLVWERGPNRIDAGSSNVEHEHLVEARGTRPAIPNSHTAVSNANWGGPIPFSFPVLAEGPALGFSVTLWPTPVDQVGSAWEGADILVNPLVQRLSLRRVRWLK